MLLIKYILRDIFKLRDIKMKVNSINSSISAGYKVTNNSFTGYYDVLREGAQKPIADLKQAQYLFEDLIMEIELDNSIKKNQFFYTVKNLCANIRLRELFNKFIKSEQDNSLVRNLLDILKNKNIVSIANDKFSVFDIISLSGTPKDIHLGFGAGKRKGYIEFYTDKKGDVFVDRSYGKDFFTRGFYSDAGTKKVDISSYAGGSPEKTYYNKDGSKPFFKNLFLGGTPTEGIY